MFLALPYRLPYAVMKSSNLLSKLQTKIWEQRAVRLAAEPNSLPASSSLQGYLDNMIVPTSLDQYLSPDGRLTGKDIVDFRHKYKPKQSRNQDKETVSYDARDHQVHSRRLLLSAECQIGKTGVYLALMQDLKAILSPSPQLVQPDVVVALPDFESVQPGSAADASDLPEEDERGQVTVDYKR